VRRLLSALTLIALASPALLGAQILKPPRGGSPGPTLWLSAGVGWFRLQDMRDGTTDSFWRFGDAAQYRATVEMAVSGGWTLGIAGSWARVPLTYLAFGGSTVCGTGSASGICDADADVQSVYGMFGSPSRPGFHQVMQFMIGATRFDNFRARSSGAALPPEHDLDFTFAVGYGFGWGIGQSSEISLVPEYANIFHQRDGLPAGERTVFQNISTRLAFRFGF
jgi:hypothetical protein